MMHQLLHIPSLVFGTLQKTKKGNSNWFPSLVVAKCQKPKKEYEAIDVSLVTTNAASLFHMTISTKKHWGLAMRLSQIPMLFGLLFFLLNKFIFN